MNQPLRVLVNDRPLRQTLTGVGHYIRQLLLAFDDRVSEIRASPFFFENLTRADWRAATTPPSARRPHQIGGSRKPWWLRRIMQGAYGALFRQAARRYELYHEPNHIPIRCNLPTVTTVHDLSVLVHPEWHPADRVSWYEAEFAAGVRQTTRFIAASEFTKREMVNRLFIAPDQIDITYQAPRPAFRPVHADAAQRALLELAAPAGAFLYVGTLEPRKNVAGLLEAYAALRPADRERHPLLVVGAWGWKREELERKLTEQRLAENVRLLGYMADEQLAALYTTCCAMVWPTLYEGFGLPPLEAMACGAPVIVSNVASLPEVVGHAGILLDPQDTPAWTDAMRQVIEDLEWRAQAAERSLEQAGRFSWSGCAQNTLECYRRALGNNSA